jgi:hypothetical protein
MPMQFMDLPIQEQNDKSTGVAYNATATKTLL